MSITVMLLLPWWGERVPMSRLVQSMASREGEVAFASMATSWRAASNASRSTDGSKSLAYASGASDTTSLR